MGSFDKPDGEIKGQMDFDEMPLPEKLVAVSRVFARAKKQMTLAEQKAFVYALTQVQFTEATKSNIVYMDKKTLAAVVGVKSDADHLSQDLRRAIGELPRHSYIQIADQDLDLYDSGVIISRITMLKNRVRLKFEDEYLGLFTGLSTDYITAWSSDIFQMQSKRSVQFYEYIRQATDSRKDVNSVLLGVRGLKELFDMPKEAYMRKPSAGGFNRTGFERDIINPICDDLKNCRLITLLLTPDGMPYEKVKRGGRIIGYRFYWVYTSHPAVTSAAELHEIQERLDKNPQLLKVARDVLKGEGKGKGKKGKKANAFCDIEQNVYDFDELEEDLLAASYARYKDDPDHMPGQMTIEETDYMP